MQIVIRSIPSAGYLESQDVTVELVRETKTLIVVKLPGSERELRLSKKTGREEGKKIWQGGYVLISK